MTKQLAILQSSVRQICVSSLRVGRITVEQKTTLDTIIVVIVDWCKDTIAGLAPFLSGMTFDEYQDAHFSMMRDLASSTATLRPLRAKIGPTQLVKLGKAMIAHEPSTASNLRIAASYLKSPKLIHFDTHLFIPYALDNLMSTSRAVRIAALELCYLLAFWSHTSKALFGNVRLIRGLANTLLYPDHGASVADVLANADADAISTLHEKGYEVVYMMLVDTIKDAPLGSETSRIANSLRVYCKHICQGVFCDDNRLPELLMQKLRRGDWREDAFDLTSVLLCICELGPQMTYRLHDLSLIALYACFTPNTTARTAAAFAIANNITFVASDYEVVEYVDKFAAAVLDEVEMTITNNLIVILIGIYDARKDETPLLTAERKAALTSRLVVLCARYANIPSVSANLHKLQGLGFK